jgi:hypothetical protein
MIDACTLGWKYLGENMLELEIDMAEDHSLTCTAAGSVVAEGTGRSDHSRDSHNMTTAPNKRFDLDAEKPVVC